MAFMGSSGPDNSERDRTAADTGSKGNGSLSRIGENLAGALGIGREDASPQPTRVASNQKDNSWLVYANQGATRNKPLSQSLVNALGKVAPELGLQIRVFSGGQAAKGSGGPRTGSVRHDHGNAADVFLYKGGQRLDWANPNHLPVMKEFVSRAKGAGITGFGAGPGYMRPGSMHIGFGSPSVWGAGGRGANAPGWLRQAYGQAPQGRVPSESQLSSDSQRLPQVQAQTQVNGRAGFAPRIADPANIEPPSQPEAPRSPFHDFALARMGGKGNVERVAGVGANLFDGMARGLGIQFGPFGPQSTPESLAALTQGIGDYNPDAAMRTINPAFGGGGAAPLMPPQARRKKLMSFDEAFPLLSSLG